MGKYNNWTRGQTEALLNKLGGEQVARDFLAGKIRLFKRSLLKATTFTLSATTKPVLLKEKKGIRFSKSVKKLFACCKSVPIPAREYSYWDVPEGMMDFRIFEEIGPESIFEKPNELSIFIKCLQEKQEKQEKSGVGLRSLGFCDNLFFVRDPENREKVLCVVAMCTIKDGYKWVLSSYCPVDNSKWFLRSRVYRNCG